MHHYRTFLDWFVVYLYIAMATVLVGWVIYVAKIQHIYDPGTYRPLQWVALLLFYGLSNALRTAIRTPGTTGTTGGSR